MLASEVQEIEEALPGLLPAFDRRAFFKHDVGRGAYYSIDAMRVYASRAVGRLRGRLQELQPSAPVTETRAFQYVGNTQLRSIVARDYDEAQRTFVVKAWKSAIILCGGSIEAILLDQVQRDAHRARACTAAPKNSDIARWRLTDLIDVCVELALITPGASKLSHSVRQYRNLVHPGAELASGLVVGEEEARIALDVLRIVDRDLS